MDIRAAILISSTLLGLTACNDLDRMDATNPEAVQKGQFLYQENCAQCHGEKLQGQPDWRSVKPDGTLPAPPHDDSGHTWHHGDELLFEYTKFGGAHIAPPGFKSGMPGYEEFLTDEQIWQVLSFIKSRWSPQNQARQERLNQR